ncbi:hypothetical protein CB1_000723004 [Camelus ferus]|nr:hypothetical protein CB1_000723004 [Camelus ferus]
MREPRRLMFASLCGPIQAAFHEQTPVPEGYTCLGTQALKVNSVSPNLGCQTLATPLLEGALGYDATWKCTSELVEPKPVLTDAVRLPRLPKKMAELKERDRLDLLRVRERGRDDLPACVECLCTAPSTPVRQAVAAGESTAAVKPPAQEVDIIT